MISANDVRRHRPSSPGADRAETDDFGFDLPEEDLYGALDVLARPNLGTVPSTVVLFCGFRRHHGQALDGRVGHGECMDTFDVAGLATRTPGR